MNETAIHFHSARRCRRWLGIAAISSACGLLYAPTLRADEPSAPTTRPALQQLNDETTALYEQVESGMVHVEIPRPMPVFRPAPPAPQQPIQPPPSESAPPSTRPADATPAEQGNVGAGPHISVVAPPGASITVTAQSSNGGQVTVVRSKMEMIPQPPPANEAGGNPALGLKMRAAMMAAANNVGILLDKQGHVLVPTFIDRPTDGAIPLRITGPDGSMQTAHFVGSDRQTNLSVLKLDKPIGTPLQWTGDRPAKGSIVLYVSPNDGSGRLGMWTGGMGEFGVVVSIDGHVDGIARFGQFLSGSSCQLIAKQLVEFGSVKRATLGIFISEIQPNDPLRAQLPQLGSRSAMRVLNVIAGSAADKAGLKIGDLVLQLAGQPVNDIPSFAAAIAARSGKTPVQILRGDKVITVNADLKAN